MFQSEENDKNRVIVYCGSGFSGAGNAFKKNKIVSFNNKENTSHVTADQDYTIQPGHSLHGPRRNRTDTKVQTQKKEDRGNGERAPPPHTRPHPTLTPPAPHSDDF